MLYCLVASGIYLLSSITSKYFPPGVCWPQKNVSRCDIQRFGIAIHPFSESREIDGGFMIIVFITHMTVCLSSYLKYT